MTYIATKNISSDLEEILRQYGLHQSDDAGIVISEDDKGQIVIKSPEAEYSIAKPYHISELFSLIRKIERYKKTSVQIIGNFQFDYSSQLLIDGNNEIPLTEKEAELIKTLLDAYPNALSRKKILNSVWGHSSDLDTHTLETHIYRLRKKLGENNSLISTEKDGYSIKLSPCT